MEVQAPHWILAIAAWPLSREIDSSIWMFAVIQCVHLLGIVLFGGALLAVDLSVLGAGFKPGDVGTVERKARPWLWAGLALIVISGILMFISEPEKCYFNPAFQFKMLALIFAVLALATIRRSALARLDDRVVRLPASLKMISILSVGLWLAVGLGGRAIGFY